MKLPKNTGAQIQADFFDSIAEAFESSETRVAILGSLATLAIGVIVAGLMQNTPKAQIVETQAQALEVVDGQ